MIEGLQERFNYRYNPARKSFSAYFDDELIFVGKDVEKDYAPELASLIQCNFIRGYMFACQDITKVNDMLQPYNVTGLQLP